MHLLSNDVEATPRRTGGPEESLRIRPEIRRLVRMRLLEWGKKHRRKFPFRRTADPYRILVSEVLLRRTTAKKVAEVYTPFFSLFPTPESLASASVLEIRKTIAPLGIYRRAQELKALAKAVVTEFGGRVPLDYSDLLKMPGVGKYIAGCVIASTEGQPMPLVDSNVERVFQRMFSLGESDCPAFSAIYLELAPPHSLRAFHHSIIDLGHLVCTPRNPRCEICPLNRVCLFARNLQL